MCSLIEEYHKPDERWSIFGINTFEEFVKNYVVVGKFHAGVPSAIIEEYKVVQRLLYYSYYYYPLLDEAFSKVTRIFESAIKIRLKELGIPAENKFESLEKKIKKLEPFASPLLKKEWLAAKEIRNIFAHPEAGNLQGILFFRAFFQMINTINTVFLIKSKIDLEERALLDLKKESLHLKKGLFKFQIENKIFLVWSILPYSIYQTNTITKSIWVFHPVFTYFPQTMEKRDFSLPIFLRLTDIKIGPETFEAVDLRSGQKVTATPASNEINKEALKKHEELIASSETIVKQHYWNYLESELGFEITKFLYEECWE